VGTVCFELLEAAGYKIVPKDEQVEVLELPTDIEEREWAEGQVKLVYHLKRERSPGLSKAKKASFIKKHGRLFCEECGTDPVEAYGDFGVACIEVHHEAIQVADMGEQHKTTLDQLRCLCANCHRVLHRKLKAQVFHSAPANDESDVMSATPG
jgi:predicted HNH restriction endonuclease